MLKYLILCLRSRKYFVIYFKMQKFNFIIASSFIILMSFLQVQQAESFIYRLITETLQNNVAGEPITHKRTEWDFDPEISQKRRSLFYETHGFRAEKFIERIGVGEDGKQNATSTT